nr:type I polyketide synthase [Azorhizobium doebereinerae]
MSGANVTAIVGAACRLPGAPDEARFRRMLSEGRCAIQPFPAGRWSVERFLHPRASEPGFSYSFAGGYLDAPFDFDPTVFGMSPREAAQVDPQQRLLMEVVWEALEDARLPPSSLAGHEVGVYVGASSLDHGNLLASDPAAIESHFMTGNTLSVVSNRLSYAFDWHGPSFTVDTACSSSLVAFSQALADLRSGRIDTAVVAGVNMLLTPASYIGFSRAGMLSPTGLCRPFSAAGDGYVRSEGAVAFVLRRKDLALPGSVRALAVAAGVNSDGRTSGIALPGVEGQRALLERLYGETGITPDQVAFVEAHGTGTRIGDPVEATAIGSVLGRGRAAPLPIGSVKSNIGHLEPASGVAGLLKAVQALETRELPRSLHLDELNPLIDFADLNLLPARETIALDRTAATLFAGVSSFGFGGTNAHVILASAPAEAPPRAAGAPAPRHLALSAATAEALRATADAYAAVLDEGVPPARLAAAVAAGRESLRHRAVAVLDEAGAMAGALRDFAAAGASKAIATGAAPRPDAKVCFVYSGNGAQAVGMGRTAYLRNAAFRHRFDEIDAAFKAIAVTGVKEDMFDPDLGARIGQASVIQPLMFAVQAALTGALVAEGLRPDMVVGHSIGEVAAAEAAGVLDLTQAVRIIHARATSQEAAYGRGLMAVFAASRPRMEEFLAGFGRDDIEIAADNGPSSLTLSGATEAIRLATREARKQRIASRTLEMEYPFHSRFLDDTKSAFLGTAGEITARRATTPLISTVTGAPIGEDLLDAAYWWRNVRAPVQFRSAIEAAAELGAGLFVEIGPRPILTSPIAETLKERGSGAAVLASFTEADDRDPRRDPVLWVVANARANGAAMPTVPATAVDRALPLPAYPWQRSTFHFHGTSAALDLFGNRPRHPLIGGRLADGIPEWRTFLDAEVVPYLADHVVDGEIVVPAAAIVEMVLAVGRELKPDGPLGLEDCDIFQPLVLSKQGMREISVRHAAATNDVELFSRPRFGADEWTLHARGRLVDVAHPPRPPAKPKGKLIRATAADIYARTEACGLHYGPAFRLAQALKRDGRTIEVALTPAQAGTGAFTRPQLLHPASLDAALHGLFLLIDVEPGVKRTYLPIRLGRLALFRDHPEVAGATIVVERHTEQSLRVSIALKDADGEVVAEVEDALLKSVVLSRTDPDDGFLFVTRERTGRAVAGGDLPAAIRAALAARPEPEPSDGWLMLRAVVRAVAHRALSRIADADGRLDWAALVAGGRFAPEARAYAAMLAEELVLAGLATPEGDTLRLAADSGLPDPDRILRTFAAEYAGASAELLLAARTAAGVDAVLRTGTPIAHRAEVLDQFAGSALLFAPALQALLATAAAARAAGGTDAPRLLVAEPDGRGLISTLLPDVRAGRIRLTVAGLDSARLERLERRLPAGVPVRFLHLDGRDGERHPSHDLALVSAWRLNGEDGGTLLARMAECLVDSGAIVAAQPAPDAVVDFILGTEPGWFGRSADPALPVGLMPSADETRAALAAAACRDTRQIDLAEGGACLIARPPEPSAPQAGLRPLRLVLAAEDETTLAQTLAAQLKAAGLYVAPTEEANGLAPREADVIVLADATGPADRVRTEQAVLRLAAVLTDLPPGPTKARLWLVVRGARTAPLDPVADALWGFGRVAMNEFSDIDIRLVDVAPGLSGPEAARRLITLAGAGDAEREILLDTDGAQVLRVRHGLPVAQGAPDPDAALTLEFPRRGALDHFAWARKARVAPGRADVEVEVLAAGLNFRDVMLAMGLLDDDVLDDGMAGAVFGFECAGRVTRVGSGVRDLAPGDVVVGFAKNAFSTHVTAPRRVFMPLPAGTTPESAASIPVAFLTAWYGLVELARLKRGETVLIHGAAGGVGLAAIQIARARGARVIATVSTPDKRALVELFGAQEVHDSRSLAFADAIRHDHGGVDVVLNSLSGEAMRAGLKCLKPFGRFVELGKRDYVANTELGLRPFRRNLTYFGVDLDQLLAHDPRLVAKGLKDLASGFTKGAYAALPYRLFGADGIGEAFRLMQSAAHVGKIVVRPPVADEIRLPQARDAGFAPEGVQLVVGGAGGFGLETALWLAARGARTIVVASRRGAVEAAALPRIDALRAAGVTFAVEQVDAGDAAAVDALVGRVAAAHGPIGGVYHTAMVLHDGLIRTLDAGQLSQVLAPKVDGARHLDRATRRQPVRHFVMFSSVSALIGNPGQGAYVAANAYLEGLARRRVAEGLPALAVGWGAISDAGVLARDQATAEQLERVTGMTGLASAEALARLERLLAADAGLTDPVVYCARWQRTGLMRDLPILATPAFADVFAQDGGPSEATELDMAALLDGKSDAEAQRVLGDLIATRIARILRLSAQEIDLDRPFAEMGMDSLMALELSMNIEHEFGVGLPLVAITSVPNLRELSRRLLQSLRVPEATEAMDAGDRRLIAMHGGDEADFDGVSDRLADRRDQVTRVM